jgi:hypothetical protein
MDSPFDGDGIQTAVTVLGTETLVGREMMLEG